MTYNVMPFYNYQYVSCLAGNSIVSVDLSCTEDFQTSDCCIMTFLDTQLSHFNVKARPI